MLNKKTLLDLIRHFIVFEKSKKEDPKTGVTSVTTVKELAALPKHSKEGLPTPNPSQEGNRRRFQEGNVRKTDTHDHFGEGNNSVPDYGQTEEYNTESSKNPKATPLPGGAGGGSYRRKILPYNPKLKELAKKLRKDMTLSEVLLWNELKQRQMLGFDFDRQRPIDEFIVDFYCKDLMLAIEIDGDSHNHEEAFAKDEIRQKRLESLGVRFLRFDDLEVKRDISNVLRTIQYWVEEHQDDLVGRMGPTP